MKGQRYSTWTPMWVTIAVSFAIYVVAVSASVIQSRSASAAIPPTTQTSDAEAFGEDKED